MMAIKSVSIRIEEERLEKIGFVADYEGRSVNSHILVAVFPGRSPRMTTSSLPGRMVDKQ